MSRKALVVGLVAAAVALGGDAFRVKLGNEKKIEHALNRLTFGPRPADAAGVRKTGLKKWIDVMFVMGGGVKGGKIHGEWPGLEREQLYEGRDLALTTDFRDVLGELVERHLGNRNLAAVFPGYGARKFRDLLG